jgi:hypothetical protein
MSRRIAGKDQAVAARVRWNGSFVLAGFAMLLAGGAVGAVIALFTPAHMQIAGSEASIRVHLGRGYDRAALSGNVLTARRATGRSVLGERIGLSVDLELDPATLATADGTFNANVVPAYLQAYSDPEQLGSDIRWALVKHLLLWTITGGVAGLVAFVAHRTYRRWRRRELDRLPVEQRSAAIHILAQQRALRRRVAALGLVVIAIGLVPGAVWRPPARPHITPDPILADTPLAGAQVGGLLRPALSAIKNYVRTYVADTDSYYDQLRAAVLAELDAQNVQLPTGADVRSFLFVTDRHCNIGMDRVIVALGQHFGIHVLVSGGDDAFSGSFPFEAACTQNLASRSQQAGMIDVFVGGNHDSPMTLHEEADQHIKVLHGQVVTADGLRFVGLPDPRTSRYGQGIEPASSAAAKQLLTEQGGAAGQVACQAGGPVIAVLHDPLAGQQAIRNGCGAVTIALDGHTHRQIGPTAVGSGEQFVGASTGGAPGESVVVRTFASRLTVGPLNHDASINIVSVDTATGALVAVTVCRITPTQDITFTQLNLV